jgi:hypothetical protein
VLAPVGFIVNVRPEQILLLFTLTSGKANTETVATAVLEEMQPAVLVPVTEYEVFESGLTVAEPLENV